jgi:hypothetical protein
MLQFINIDNIIRIYEANSKIYIELIGYTTIRNNRNKYSRFNG